MLQHLLRRLAGILTLGALATSAAFAQTLDGPLRIVVGYAPGGATDRVARIVGDKLQAKLGVPVVVDNKPGAGGRLAAQQVKATPAGQNVLMLANPAVMVVAPLVFKDNGYDAERDFVPVSHVNDYEFALSVSTAVPVRELSHLLAWMRANPDKANVGVPATGSLPHFFGLMVGEKAKVQTAGGRLPRLGAPADRPDRRAGADRRRHAGRGHPAAPGRQGAHPRDVGREALALRARGADLQGGRARPRRARAGTPSSHRRACRARRSRATRKPSARSCRTRTRCAASRMR